MSVAEKRYWLVTGLPRGGTSVVAGIMDALGVDMGTGLDVGVYYPPYEDRGLHRLNTGWTDNVPMHRRERMVESLGAYMHERIGQSEHVGGKWPWIVRCADVPGFEKWPISTICVRRPLEDVIRSTMHHYDGKKQQLSCKPNASGSCGRHFWALERFNKVHVPKLELEHDEVIKRPLDAAQKIKKLIFGVDETTIEEDQIILNLVKKPTWREAQRSLAQSVHQVWLSDGASSPLPDKLAALQSSWVGEDHRVWDLDGLRNTFVQLASYEQKARSLWSDRNDPAMKFRGISDIYRVGLLIKYGGLYVDTDCERVADVWPRIEQIQKEHPDKVIVFERPNMRPGKPLANACIYSPRPNHPAMVDLMNRIGASLLVESEKHRFDGSGRRPTLVTGPTVLLESQTAIPDQYVVSYEDGFLRQPSDGPHIGTCVKLHQGWRFKNKGRRRARI